MRRRRAVTLILLTMLAPGSAQLIAGNRRLGRLGLRVWLSTLVVLLLLGVLGVLRRSVVLGLFSRTWVMLVVAVLLAILAVGWLILFADALRLGRLSGTPPRTRALVGGLTALLIGASCGTLALTATNVLAGRSAVLNLFGSTVSKPPEDGRYNVLLLGGDSGASRVGTRPDTIMLASVDADTGQAAMFGFARDTENINFRDGSVMKALMPEGWNCRDQCLLNGLYTWATEHQARFPKDVKDPGALATKEAVEALSGLTVHYYVMVDLKGFQRLIDAVGGLDINVKKRTPIGGGTSAISGYIEPGVQHLDGYHALWYARSRTRSSNDERMARQRCVLTAISRQLSPQSVLVKFKDIAGVSGSVLQTDIPESDLGAFADLALKSRQYKIKSVNFVRPLIQPWNYDPAFVHETVRETIAASERAETTAAKPEQTRRASSGTSSGASSGSGSTTSSGGGTAGAGSTSTDPSADDLAEVCSAA